MRVTTPPTVAYPIEVAHRIGIEKIIITNAAGGVNEQFMPGDLMFIKDYNEFVVREPARWQRFR